MSRSPLAVILAVALGVSLSSCNRGPEEEARPTPSPPEAQHLPPGESLARLKIVVEGAQTQDTIYLYVGDYFLGTAPLDHDVYLKGEEKHDVRAVVPTPDNDLAPFYVQTKAAAVKKGEQRTVSFKIPELAGHGSSDAGARTQYELPQCFGSGDGDETISAQVRELELERLKLESEVREVSYSPMFQQLAALYNAAFSSPPRQGSMVFRGVPVWTYADDEAKSQEISLAVAPEQIRQLGRWMVEDKFRLNGIVGDLEAMNAHAQRLMSRARECTSQKALDAAFFESRMIQETLVNARNARLNVEKTAENLAKILESAAQAANPG